MKRVLVAIECGIALLAILVLFISVDVSTVDPESCRHAVEKYRSAKADVTAAFGGYADCIADRDGREDCHREFALLGRKQGDLKSAVGVLSRKRAMDYHLDGLFSGHYGSECVFSDMATMHDAFATLKEFSELK
jgi:hypothetical protein